MTTRPQLPDWPGPGAWIAASRALGRPAWIGEPYPHICGTSVTNPIGRRVRFDRRDCTACTRPDLQLIHGGQAA